MSKSRSWTGQLHNVLGFTEDITLNSVVVKLQKYINFGINDYLKQRYYLKKVFIDEALSKNQSVIQHDVNSFLKLS